jgi:hypothetical protein
VTKHNDIKVYRDMEASGQLHPQSLSQRKGRVVRLGLELSRAQDTVAKRKFCPWPESNSSHPAGTLLTRPMSAVPISL